MSYCAYRKGDVVRKGDAMGLVIENNGRFLTYQIIEPHGTITSSTPNLKVRHYLKLVRADQTRPKPNTSSVVRNLTLEQELLDADDEQQQLLINGEVDRLSETPKKINAFQTIE